MQNVNLLIPFSQHSVTVSHRLKVNFSILDFVEMDSYSVQPIPEGVQRLRLLFVDQTEGLFCCHANDPNVSDVLDVPVELDVIYKRTGYTAYKPLVGQLCAAVYNGMLLLFRVSEAFRPRRRPHSWPIEL